MYPTMVLRRDRDVSTSAIAISTPVAALLPAQMGLYAVPIENRAVAVCEASFASAGR